MCLSVKDTYMCSLCCFREMTYEFRDNKVSFLSRLHFLHSCVLTSWLTVYAQGLRKVMMLKSRQGIG